MLLALNVNTGEYVWRVPLGVVEELEAKDVKDTGTMNMGGSFATAGGLGIASMVRRQLEGSKPS